MSGDAIEGLRQRDKSRRAGKKVAAFYEDQNEHIDSLLKPLSTLSAEGAQEVSDNAFKVKLAVNISFGMNCILAVLQLYAAISSGSLALFATMVDSVCDPVANLILWIAHRSAAKAEERKWPLGGSRFETAGNIIFGHLMFAVNLVLIVQSIREFVEHTGSETTDFDLTSIIVVGVAFGIKLALFTFCLAIRQWSSQVQVLWEDHRNDLFTNGFGILTAAGGGKLAWWLDPMGAMIIALVIMSVWARTIYTEFKQLCGIAAPAEYMNLVTYKAMTFSPEIISIDTVKIYHSGPQYFVEIDIVLPPDMPLWRAHDIAQDLQDQIEALPDVDRCFVHVDHEVDHKPEHRKKV